MVKKVTASGYMVLATKVYVFTSAEAARFAVAAMETAMSTAKLLPPVDVFYARHIFEDFVYPSPFMSNLATSTLSNIDTDGHGKYFNMWWTELSEVAGISIPR